MIDMAGKVWFHLGDVYLFSLWKKWVHSGFYPIVANLLSDIDKFRAYMSFRHVIV
jgi:hypothetical protein